MNTSDTKTKVLAVASGGGTLDTDAQTTAGLPEGVRSPMLLLTPASKDERKRK